jgi:hypothetical protein
MPRMDALRVILAFVVFASFILGQQPAEAADTPATVSVGVRIDNLGQVDDVRELWGVNGLLITSWMQSNLRYDARNRDSEHRDIPAAAAHAPSLIFANAAVDPSFRQIDLFVQPNGRIFQIQEFHAVLSTVLDLRRFPFDSEDLPLVILPVGHDVDRISLAPDTRHSQVVHGGYSALSQWTIIDLKMEKHSESYFGGTQHGVQFDLRVRRNSQSYVWKFILPLCLIVMVSWIGFWLSPVDFKSKDLLTTAVTTLLIVVAFTLSISGLLPRTSYLTYIDGFLLTCYAFVIVAIATSAVINDLEFRGQDKRAMFLRKLSAAALPVCFAVIQIAVLLYFRMEA